VGQASSLSFLPPSVSYPHISKLGLAWISLDFSPRQGGVAAPPKQGLRPPNLMQRFDSVGFGWIRSDLPGLSRTHLDRRPKSGTGFQPVQSLDLPQFTSNRPIWRWISLDSAGLNWTRKQLGERARLPAVAFLPTIVSTAAEAKEGPGRCGGRLVRRHERINASSPPPLPPRPEPKA